jgi:UDP-GlcNAc:undecaprenyl-phosphate GlcNAc-1-phosphate transferase
VLVANLGLLGRAFKSFLGDSGARFLGFFLVYVIIVEGSNALTPVHAAYFVALPLLDMCAVVWERWRAGRRIMKADRAHLHFQLQDFGVSRLAAVLVMGGVALGFVALAFALRLYDAPEFGVLTVFLALAIVYCVGRRAFVRAVASRLRPRQVVGPVE